LISIFENSLLHFRHGFLFCLTELIAIPWTYTRRTCRAAWRGEGWASCWLTRPSRWLKSGGSPSAHPAGTSPAISVGKRTALPKQGDFWIFCFVLYSTLLHLPPSDTTVSEDAGIEPRTVATLALAVRRSNHSARSRPQSARSHPQSARSHPQTTRSHLG
jgi:hypothetical protein